MKRLCKVGKETGYFHLWEQFSKPIPASPLIGGSPAGVFSTTFGIVEFSDGIRRVDPTDIKFVEMEVGMREDSLNYINEMLGEQAKLLNDLIVKQEQKLLSIHEEDGDVSRIDACISQIGFYREREREVLAVMKDFESFISEMSSKKSD